MNLSPCKGCKDRCVEPNCHNTCRKYIDWKAEYEKLKDRKSKEARIYWSGLNKNWYKE